ncbi:hypothetical protein L218DRAFT_159361 [Marasmius fiardii PR-910]|nr:hypothetical protein L218DRAFT_159361 [Marasmius fiardii PR-910]
MAGDKEPLFGSSLNLFELFGIPSTAVKIFMALIVILSATYLLLRYRYPCRSPSSLMQAVEQAKKVFNECHSSNAFKEGEYDKFHRSLHQITARASEISTRTHPNDYRSDDPTGSPTDYLERVFSLCKQLRDVVKCHREAQRLIRELEICMIRASHSHSNFQLQDRRAVVAPVVDNPVDALV